MITCLHCYLPGKFVYINTSDKTAMGYYMIKFTSEAYKLQEETMCDGKICTAFELVIEAQYMNCMQSTGNNHHTKNISFLQHTQFCIHVRML